VTTRRSEDTSSGPGLTPIDSSSPSSPTDRRTEPDRTTGRIPAQDVEDDAASKNRKPGKNKKNAGVGR
jgi:hypothetical protein